MTEAEYMKRFIKLENEFGDIVIERIDRIHSIQKNGEGVRIWWDNEEEGVDYLTLFCHIAVHLEIN